MQQPSRPQSTTAKPQDDASLPVEESDMLVEKNTQQNVMDDMGIKDQERVLITGDDILIEYVDRLIHEIQNINDADFKPNWRSSIEKFITHYVWHSQDAVQ